MRLQAVLFDLGGTLLYYRDWREDVPDQTFRRVREEGIRLVYERLCADGFMPPPLEDFLASVERAIQQDIAARDGHLISGLIEKPVRAGLAEAGVALSDQEWKRLRQDFYRPYDRLVFPRLGLRSTLEALGALHYQLGLISNTYWASDVHDRHLARYGVLDILPMRIYSCEASHSKPHPSIFMEAVRRLGLEPEQVAYVGDRPDVDIVGAQNVGLRGILIRTPYRPVDLGDVVPDAVINELPELIPVLEELRAGHE